MIYHCAALDLLRACPDNALDAAATDPPYGLGFMGRDWDRAMPDPHTWVELLRAMKPGAHAMIFGAPRLDHRLAVHVEDAGFEIRDKLMWLFGSGFPKGGNITEDHGILLKPAYETILLARKPLEGTVRENIVKWGTGALNIGACRVGDGGGTRKKISEDVKNSRTISAYGNGLNGGGCEPIDAGRWPANVIMDEETGALLDRMVGRLRSGGMKAGTARGANNVFGKAADIPASEGGASRFFYCPKASRSEREAGLEHRAPRTVGDGRKTAADNAFQRGKTERRNTHPTVKPIELMRWLVRLITPENGTVIDPFVGSGTTAIAAALEGFDFVGCDLDEDHVSIARDRVEHWKGTKT